MPQCSDFEWFRTTVDTNPCLPSALAWRVSRTCVAVSRTHQTAVHASHRHTGYLATGTSVARTQARRATHRGRARQLCVPALCLRSSVEAGGIPATCTTKHAARVAHLTPNRLSPCGGITRTPPHAPQKRQGSPPSAALRSTVRYCSSPLRRPFPQGPQQARPCKPKCATAGRPADLSIESAAVGPADQKTDKGGAADQKTPLKGEVFTSRSRDDSPSCPRSPLLPFQVGVACGGGSSPLVDGPDDE